jgi:hypothetical protein
MAGSQELPQLVTELVDMSKTYLQQETIEPAKRLGRMAGLGMAAGAVLALGAILFVLGAYALFNVVLPAGEWWNVLARGLAALVAAAGAGLVAWRMTR